MHHALLTSVIMLSLPLGASGQDLHRSRPSDGEIEFLTERLELLTERLRIREGVAELHQQEGEIAKRGLERELEASRSAFEESQVRIVGAQRNLERLEKLKSEGLANEAKLDEARTRLSAARSERLARQAQLLARESEFRTRDARLKREVLEARLDLVDARLEILEARFRLRQREALMERLRNLRGRGVDRVAPPEPDSSAEESGDDAVEESAEESASTEESAE